MSDRIESCRWLQPFSDELGRRVNDAIRDFHSLIGEVELRGNRGYLPDMVNRRFGSPLGSPYCANTVGFVLERNGLIIPKKDVGACDEWARMAFARSTWSDVPALGAVSCYGTTKVKQPGLPFDVQHVGLVAQLDTMAGDWDLQANTSAYGYSRNGLATLIKPIDGAWLLGFILPEVV